MDKIKIKKVLKKHGYPNKVIENVLAWYLN